MAKRPLIRLAPQFVATISRAEVSIADLAREAGVAKSTIHALLNPSQHPDRKGGMHPATAWKLANAYARLAGVTPDAAYAALIAEGAAEPGGGAAHG